MSGTLNTRTALTPADREWFAAVSSYIAEDERANDLKAISDIAAILIEGCRHNTTGSDLPGNYSPNLCAALLDLARNAYARTVARQRGTLPAIEVKPVVTTTRQVKRDRTTPRDAKPAPCGRCQGTGIYKAHNFSGQCFRCRGTGLDPEYVIVEVKPVAPVKPEPAAPAEPLILPTGTYTLEYKDAAHFTFRVREVKTGSLTGKTIVEYLAGPDNSLDFVAFATVNQTSINVWRKFERGPLVNRAREIEAVARGDKAALESAGLAYALKSSRCRRCNKVLTVPASIHAGYGPDCLGKVGGGGFAAEVEYAGADEAPADLEREIDAIIAPHRRGAVPAPRTIRAIGARRPGPAPIPSPTIAQPTSSRRTVLSIASPATAVQPSSIATSTRPITVSSISPI